MLLKIKRISAEDDPHITERKKKIKKGLDE